ncbi:DUF2486 family protein [Trinickia violacea]|uniref:DUF2486 family protein n=1 Tax=Trinickia violacea TaxID=2571746 RepID=UPI0015868391
MPDPNDDNAFPVLTDVLVQGKPEPKPAEEKKVPAPSGEPLPDDASIPTLNEVLTPGLAGHARSEAPRPKEPAAEPGASAPAAVREPVPVPAATPDEDSFPVLTDVVASGIADWAASVAESDSDEAAGRHAAPTHESAPSAPIEPAGHEAAARGIAAHEPPVEHDADAQAKASRVQPEASASHAAAEVVEGAPASPVAADEEDKPAPADEAHAHHHTGRSSHHAKSQTQPEETHDEDEQTETHRAKSHAQHASTDEQHVETPAHHRTKSHRATAHSKAHHPDDAHDVAVTALDADIIAERLRGRFASYLMGEGRGFIEARCRDALQDQTNWLVNQITREVALALEVEVAGWVREAVREALAKHADNAS